MEDPIYPDETAALKLLASCLVLVSNISYIPQFYTMYKMKTTAGISKLSYWINLLVAIGWLLYTYQLQQWTQVYSNVAWFVLTSITLGMLYYYDKPNDSLPKRRN